MTETRILVVDDEPAVLRALRVALEATGFAVTAVMNGTDAVARAVDRPHALVLLDLGLGEGLDGFDVIRRIRAFAPELPIIILSAQGEVDAKVEALDAGADDYVEKPFAVPELLARVRVAVRHGQQRAGAQSEATQITRGVVELDFLAHEVTVRGSRVELTPTQFEILACFARHPGRLLTHRAIVAEVWGDPSAAGAESLRVHISQLRRKIELDPAHPTLIGTEPGLGYRLTP